MSEAIGEAWPVPVHASHRLTPSASLATNGTMAGASFYDLDGTLVRSNLVHSYLYTSLNQGSLLGALKKTALGIARAPALWAVDQLDRVAMNELLFQQYEGQYEDVLEELAEGHFRDVLEPNLLPGGLELIARGKKLGLRQVIVSGNLDVFVRPLARHLGIDDILCNHLEIKRGRATGKLVPPVLAGATKARIIQEYAERHGLSLLESYAYSDSFSDYPMLAVVGRPAAVNPDAKLRRAARTFDWPVLTLE